MTAEQHGAVVQALAELAQTDDVAGYLTEHGHRGVSGEQAACPVAIYLRDHTDVDVRIGSLMWWFDGEIATSGGVLPQPVEQFVERFDGGAYPELDVIATPDPTAPQQNGDQT